MLNQIHLGPDLGKDKLILKWHENPLILADQRATCKEHLSVLTSSTLKNSRPRFRLRVVMIALRSA